MVKNSLIPILLLKNQRLVKTISFDTFRDVGNPVSAAKIYDAQSVDELILLDISASSKERGTLIDIIDRVTEECFMPLTVGGGIKTIEDIHFLLKTGADKISINTAAVEDPAFIQSASEKFGSANIVVSIDYKEINGKNWVFTHGGKNNTGLEVLKWAIEAAELGAGELLINCIDRDGTMQGYDISTLRKISDSVDIPIIACGGAGTLKDFTTCIKEGKVSAVAAGSIFHFTDQSPIKARAFMKEAGINIRFGV